jgi:hypothetical protein
MKTNEGISSIKKSYKDSDERKTNSFIINKEETANNISKFKSKRQ